MRLTKERIKKLICGMFLIFFFALSLSLSEESREALLSSLELCAKTLVPSIFPFAVFGHLVGSGIAEFPSFLTAIIMGVFGVSESGAKALLPGLFAGFPVGCGGAAGMYERGEIDERELCRICAFSTTPGAAFVISGVGAGMFGSKRIGIFIYISVMISVFAVGLVTRGRRKKEDKNEARFTSLSTPRFWEALTDAVSKSGYSMLVMTAFVVFFSQISLFFTAACECLARGDIISAVIKALIEVSAASKTASRLGGKGGILLAVLACAWSGISVQMQTLAVCERCRSKRLMKAMLFLRAVIAMLSLSVCVTLVWIVGLY